MFGLLNSSQIYGFQQTHEKNILPNQPTKPNPKQKQRRTSSNASDTAKENKFLASLSSAASNGMKSPTNFIEKFIRSELLSGYDTIKNYKNSYQSVNKTPGSPQSEGVIPSFNCLHGSYRSSVEGEFYEAININANCGEQQQQQHSKTSDMTAKSSTTTSSQQQQQNPSYQKLSDSDVDLTPSLLNSSGASSGEFNSSDSTSTTTTHTTTATNYNNLFRKMQNGSVKVLKNLEVISGNGNEITSDNSSSSISTTTNSSTSSSNHTSNKSNDLQRTSSSASSGLRERKKSNTIMVMTHRSSPEVVTSTSETNAKNADTPTTHKTSAGGAGATSERSQRRKLMQMISNYDQQNKLLQLELAKEKRRRNEELACVVKSLLCFESKLKTDMKSVNQRLLEKDAEICRLVRQNRALRKQLQKVREVEGENTKDEGVVEDGELMDATADTDAMDDDVEDCLVLEALQCNNCRKQFYDIDLKESFTQTGKDGSRNNDDHTTELGSSSDDTVSSSFYGARRSVRYTSKRTSGTFRDYMRSRSMNIDDDDDCPSQLENNSEENTSSISRNDSHRSYEKMNIYSRTIERMHGVKGANDMGQELRSVSRASNKSSSSKSSSSSKNSSVKSETQVEEDDGIFSPTQDDDYEEEEEEEVEESYKTTKRRSMEFSEASPKQVYETSTDDWYASASDQEDTSSAPKAYAQNAVNPVLECVNQILLQQSMEEPMLDDDEETKPILRKSSDLATNNNVTPIGTPKTPTSQVASIAATSSLPRRSSLSGRHSSRSDSHSSDSQPSRSGTLTRKRVHFSTKNSMVHVPRNEDMEHDDEDQHDVDMHPEDCSLLPGVPTTLPPSLAHYHPMNNFFGTPLKPQSPQSMQSSGLTNNSATPPTVIYAASPREEHLERLDTLNYESIYSNEYEPIGSEHNSSNLYVDMESNAKQMEQRMEAKLLQLKMPPALPPKPANLLKFKKSLQQLDEMPDEHLQQDDCAVSTTTASEPDYCSILEVNMGGMRSVQIKADVHKAPESEPDLEQTASVATELECQAASSVHSDDTCAETHKTDEIEEIFADIPKLPNVAAIIAPKQSSKFRPEVNQSNNNDHYLLMSPKVESGGSKKLTLSLNTSDNDFLLGSASKAIKSPKIESPGLTLQLGSDAAARQYKRKHVPNILAEINKRMYNTPVPNSPSTPTKTSLPSPTAKKPSPLLQSPMTPQTLPLLQAEFDWYNLDAEYGKSPSHHHSGSSASSSHTPDILKGSDNLGIAGSLLEEIHEDHESVVATADEYNLDEEFSLTSERPDLVLSEEQEVMKTEPELPKMSTSLSVICEAGNFPLFSESSPQQPPVQQPTKVNAKKMRKNLANFEKFIEGSGLSTKTLPSKRKIYFAGPFV